MVFKGLSLHGLFVCLGRLFFQDSSAVICGDCLFFGHTCSTMVFSHPSRFFWEPPLGGQILSQKVCGGCLLSKTSTKIAKIGRLHYLSLKLAPSLLMFFKRLKLSTGVQSPLVGVFYKELCRLKPNFESPGPLSLGASFTSALQHLGSNF